MIRLLALAVVVLLVAPAEMFAEDGECPEARARAALALASASVPVRHVTRTRPAPAAPATPTAKVQVQVCDGNTCRMVDAPASAAGCEYGCRSCSQGNCTTAGACGMSGCTIAGQSYGSGGSCSGGGFQGPVRRFIGRFR